MRFSEVLEGLNLFSRPARSATPSPLHTQAVADKAGYQLVLDKGSEQTVKIVIFNKDTIDLTEQVIKEFDRTNK